MHFRSQRQNYRNQKFYCPPLIGLKQNSPRDFPILSKCDSERVKMPTKAFCSQRLLSILTISESLWGVCLFTTSAALTTRIYFTGTRSSFPPIYGRRTSGILTEPSAFRLFSRNAINIRGGATTVLFNV